LAEMSLARCCPVCEFARARSVWHEQQLRYVRCSRCGVVFSDVDASTYNGAARNAWHDAKPSNDTHCFYGTARELAHERFLQRFPPSGTRRLLDVGCGLGYFMASAAAAGWTTYGCDTSEQWVRHAGARTGTPERIACSEPRQGLFDGNFEMITAWDVLEHIHDPLPFLRAIADLLVPGGGRVFIRTPNVAWIYPTYAVRRHLLGGDVVLGPLNHVVYYSAHTLRRALALAGLATSGWPVLPPPQVVIGNRRPGGASRRSATIMLKNLHAATAERLAHTSGGRVVLGADLDVVAFRA
jgi:2-polyprenyl-3-methyl-5-hydroxy-6-metoxy-1,4-benzoquinol methylase